MNISALRLRWLYLRGAFWWMGLAFTLVGLVLILIGTYIWRTEREFQKHLVRTVATVTAKEKDQVPNLRGKSGSEDAFYLVYSFSDSVGGKHQGKLRVSQEVWQKGHPGDSLAIEYDGTDPATNRRAGIEPRAGLGLLILGGVGGLFSFVGITLAGIAFLISGRRARLVQSGTPALGEADS